MLDSGRHCWTQISVFSSPNRYQDWEWLRSIPGYNPVAAKLNPSEAPGPLIHFFGFEDIPHPPLRPNEFGRHTRRDQTGRRPRARFDLVRGSRERSSSKRCVAAAPVPPPWTSKRSATSTDRTADGRTHLQTDRSCPLFVGGGWGRESWRGFEARGFSGGSLWLVPK